ncbi:MAG: hypothetical protein ACT4PX_09940 [Actinomycetota bacterium]
MLMLFAKSGDRVEAEAAALAAAGGHPGVVEAAGLAGGVLRTHLVDGSSAAELGPLDPDEVAGLAGAVAATLADLHDAGVVHGGLDASHVLVAPEGRVVLCSLGRGGHPADDVAALGRLVEGLLAGGGSRGAGRRQPGTRPGRRRRPRPPAGRGARSEQGGEPDPAGATPAPGAAAAGRQPGVGGEAAVPATPGRWFDPAGATTAPGAPAAGRQPDGVEVPGPLPLRRRSGPAGARARTTRARDRLRVRARLGPMLEPPAAPPLAALAAEAAHPDRDRRPTARAFAVAVQQRIPTARIPVPPARRLVPATPAPGPAGRRSLRPWPGRRGGLGLVAAAGSAGVVVLLSTTSGDHRPPVPRAAASDPASTTAPASPGPGPATSGPTSTTAPATAAPPIATQVWPPASLQYADGVLTVDGARYALGQPGDAVAAGDWTCSGHDTLALLRPSTGEVYAFDGWATDSTTVAGRRVGQVDGGTGLRALDTDGDGCDDLEVDRPGAPPVRLEVAS